jgi:glutamyl-Q tRNA(Asp) synthetase
MSQCHVSPFQLSPVPASSPKVKSRKSPPTLPYCEGQILPWMHLNFATMTSVTLSRFAPSPTGRLHCGHACSAFHARQLAIETGGQFILRIEDIDFTRCREEFTIGIFEDLTWLGFHWPTPVRRQSQHLPDYQQIADKLLQRGLLYPCFCTRQEIQREIAAAGGAPHGSEGPLYPGTCRRLSTDERQFRMHRGDPFALRLNLIAALESVRLPLEWTDLIRGPQLATPELLGDVILVRRDIGCSYHLCVVHDDALQGITHVSRGIDLFDATHLHRLLQELLQLPVPVYRHHPLILDADGRRLAKRDKAETILSLRTQGLTPADVMQRAGF